MERYRNSPVMHPSMLCRPFQSCFRDRSLSSRVAEASLSKGLFIGTVHDVPVVLQSSTGRGRCQRFSWPWIASHKNPHWSSRWSAASAQPDCRSLTFHTAMVASVRSSHQVPAWHLLEMLRAAGMIMGTAWTAQLTVSPVPGSGAHSKVLSPVVQDSSARKLVCRTNSVVPMMSW